jgi:hypothetical protein
MAALTSPDARPGGRVRPGPTEDRVPEPRRVRYDWADVPLHWVPGEPHLTHILNTLHLFLPAGERWFIKVFKQAQPLIEDPLLYEQVRAFMSQEGMHATAHDSARRHLEEQGLDVSGYLRAMDAFFVKVLGDRNLSPRLDRGWLNVRLAGIAAIEHYTAVLGEWILAQEGLDAADPDPTMMDLLKWHGAEEVEHRSVAYDLYQHLCGSLALRRAVSQVVFPGLIAVVWGGAVALYDEDPYVHDRRFLRSYLRAQSRGQLPRMDRLFASGARYVSRDYHPSGEGDLARAFAYIEQSPSHRAAR